MARTSLSWSHRRDRRCGVWLVRLLIRFWRGRGREFVDQLGRPARTVARDRGPARFAADQPRDRVAELLGRRLRIAHALAGSVPCEALGDDEVLLEVLLEREVE